MIPAISLTMLPEGYIALAHPSGRTEPLHSPHKRLRFSTEVLDCQSYCSSNQIRPDDRAASAWRQPHRSARSQSLSLTDFRQTQPDDMEQHGHKNIEVLRHKSRLADPRQINQPRRAILIPESIMSSTRIQNIIPPQYERYVIQKDLLEQALKEKYNDYEFEVEVCLDCVRSEGHR